MLRRQISNNTKTGVSIGLGFCAVAILLIVAFGRIATAESFDSNAAGGLQISPAVVELNAERGKVYTLNLKVLNVTNSDLKYESSIHDFGAKDESGSPSILADNSLPSSASVRSWIQTLGQFSLKHQEQRGLDVTITIPKDAEPGGHYGVVSLTGTDPQLVGTGVGATATTGLLILIRVDGDIKEKLSLASFTTQHAGKDNQFFEMSPVSFVTRLRNEGNVHVKPVGKIQIRDMFGSQVASLDVNKSAANVLPDSTRRFESVFNKSWLFGRYTAEMIVGYGTKGQVTAATTTFWVIPYKLILIVLAALLTLGFIIYRLIKAYNRRIIKKAIDRSNNTPQPPVSPDPDSDPRSS